MMHYISLSEKQIQSIIMGLIALFALAIVMECLWFLWYPLGNKTSLLQSQVTKSVTNKPPGQTLGSAAIFGLYVPKDATEDSVKKSLLNVTLVGILLAETESNSQVILRLPGGEEKTFLVGDQLPGGAIIKRITEKGMLLLRNGELESISLPKSTLLFEPKPTPMPFQGN